MEDEDDDESLPFLTSQHQTLDTPRSILIDVLTTSLNHQNHLPRRSHSAPSVFTTTKAGPTRSPAPLDPRPQTPVIVRQAAIGLIAYVIICVAVFCFTSGMYTGTKTVTVVDGLYFTVVTLCTIGYGDIVPDRVVSKVFTCVFILVGFGFVDILLNGLVTYVLDRQEAVLLGAVDENQFNKMVRTYMVDTEKGRMRIRTKVCLALGVVIICIAIGTVTAHYLEAISWVDSFYLSVTSVTTVGYGDYAFKTVIGRSFAIVWLLVSTLAVARAFLYLTELRIDKRNRRIAKWVLHKKMTLGDLVSADLDNDGSISKSEYVIYKLKEMGKIREKDIVQICKQFESLENSYNGKITVAGLMEDEHD
ncbi:Two-pore potassium channel 3-like protein [Drosera capensis]